MIRRYSLRKQLLDFLKKKKYPVISAFELRNLWGIKGYFLSPIEDDRFRVYIPLPKEYADIVQDMLNSKELSLVVDMNDYSLFEYDGFTEGFFFYRQPDGAFKKIGNKKMSLSGKALAIKFKGNF